MNARRAALCLVALGMTACRSEELLLLPPDPNARDPEPELDTRVRVNPDTGVMVRQWQLLVFPNGRTLKHGFERGWYPDGAREFERAFAEGQPTGLWLSWHPDGTPRSEYAWSLDGAPTPMSFWYPNGVLSAEGQATEGRREGRWVYRYESGGKREEGEYRGNARHGEWTFYREDGSILSRGRYANGQRVGDWQHPPDPHAAVELPGDESP